MLKIILKLLSSQKQDCRDVTLLTLTQHLVNIQDLLAKVIKFIRSSILSVITDQSRQSSKSYLHMVSRGL